MILNKFRNTFWVTMIVLVLPECKPSEDVGLGQYFLSNNSNFTIAINCNYIKSVMISCDSCVIGPATQTKLGEDSNFGTSPRPNETITSIKVYKNDTLKIELKPPFADSLWKSEKGIGEYDWNYILKIENGHLQ